VLCREATSAVESMTLWRLEHTVYYISLAESLGNQTTDGVETNGPHTLYCTLLYSVHAIW
jgi:hypothetical protein